MGSTSHTSKSLIKVEQPIEISQPVRVINDSPAQDVFQNLSHYAVIADGATVAVWTPASGKKMHLVSFVISVPGAGVITLYDRTPPATDTVFATLDFNNRQSVPFALNTDLDFGYNHILAARWVQDPPGGGTAYMTAIGHEHSPS